MTCRLDLPAGSHGEAGPFWLVLDGYLDLADPAAGSHWSACSHHPARLVADRLLTDGMQALATLRGCFSTCAVWPQQGRWLLYRSHLGGRSAYHHQAADGRWRAAAGSAAAVAALHRYRFAADSGYLASVMALRMPPPAGRSPFKGIAELQAGTCLEASERHWHTHPAMLRPPVVDNTVSNTQARQRFAATFRRAVHASLDPARSEGRPVAIMLSGGMDSSPIAAVAADLLAGRQRLLPVTWSLPGFADADETAWVDLTCRHLGLEPLRFDGTDFMPFGCLDGRAINPEVPHFNPYRGLMDACYRLAAEAGCRIVLNGNAGDMIYPPGSLRLLDLLQRRQGRQLLSALRRLHRQCGWRDALRQPEVRRLLSWLPGRNRRPPAPWLNAPTRALLAPDTAMAPAAADHPWPEYAWQLLGPRMAFGRAQENIAANRHGVDRRDPFHNQGLVELMLSLPVHTSLGLHQDKHLMRESMRGRLPEAVRRKGRTGLLHGFMAEGFRRHRDDLRQLLRSDDAWQELVDPAAVWPLLSGQPTTPTEQLLVGQCAGLVLWQQHWRE